MLYNLTKNPKYALLGRFFEIKECINLSFIHSFNSFNLTRITEEIACVDWVSPNRDRYLFVGENTHKYALLNISQLCLNSTPKGTRIGSSSIQTRRPRTRKVQIKLGRRGKEEKGVLLLVYIAKQYRGSGMIWVETLRLKVIESAPCLNVPGPG